ncbi:MAG: hypothetical protein IPP94_18885 [Ignavibacteria bacterium]|nr:hypothetical protein [Ignavibacteria bacterium]
MAAERYNPVIAAMAQRLKENGKAPRVRLVAGMRKLPGLVDVCWVSDRRFDLAHWQRDVERAKANGGTRRASEENGAAVLSPKTLQNAQRPDYLARSKENERRQPCQGES